MFFFHYLMAKNSNYVCTNLIIWESLPSFNLSAIFPHCFSHLWFNQMSLFSNCDAFWYCSLGDGDIEDRAGKSCRSSLDLAFLAPYQTILSFSLLLALPSFVLYIWALFNLSSFFLSHLYISSPTLSLNKNAQIKSPFFPLAIDLIFYVFPKICMLKLKFSMWWYLEVRYLRGDWAWRCSPHAWKQCQCKRHPDR